MSKLTKVVNIFPSMPITNVNPPIRVPVRRVKKTTDVIRNCLLSRAIVEEILPNGKTIRLTMGNYNAINDYEADAPEVVVEEPEVVTSVVEETAPEVVDEEQEVIVDETNSAWDEAYANALEGVDLASMTKKQRKEAKAAARAAADAACAEMKSADDTEPVVEETVAEVVVEESEVVTADAEDLSEVTE